MPFAAHLPARSRGFHATSAFLRAHVAFLIRLVLVAFVSSGLCAFAQQPIGLSGEVHDPLGAVVVDASVTLLDRDQPVAHTTTGQRGEFHFAVPSPGRYQVRVQASTFETTTTPGVFVGASRGASLAVTLATATLTQEVTVTATGTPTPQAQIGASVSVLPAAEFSSLLEVQDPLRLFPGLQITQVGEIGGTTGLSIRGGSTDANKVLVDDVPANSIGGAVEFANLANVGIDSIEVLREPDSALYGSDALAGVVSLRSTRGSTPYPLFSYSGEGGNFGTYRNEVTVGAAIHTFDFYSAFARVDTSNNIPNSEFHNATYAGNFGWHLNPANDLRFTVRHIDVSGGQPNAIAFYGIPDDAQQKEQDDYYNAAWNSQTTPRWHNQIRYGGLRLNGQFDDFAAVGIPDGAGDTDGAPVTITGANGYSVQGQALFYTPYDPVPSSYLENTRRDFVDAQTYFRFNPHLMALGGFKYENESGLNGYLGATPTTIQRGNYSYTVQLSGEFKNRLFYNLGTGLEDNGLFGFAATPRASLAYYPFASSPNRWLAQMKLHGSFGKGIKEPSIFQQADSLYGTLAALPNGSELIDQYHVAPVGAENSRTFDGGLDQELFGGNARVGVTYFHNEFTNGVEYVPQQGLLDLGIPAANLPAFAGAGAYVNSFAFRSQGIEFESEFKLNRALFARGGYTYTDAVVQHSLDSDNLDDPSSGYGPTYNTAFNFGTVPIGAYSPLVGARPFRVAPHSGYFALNYTQSKWYSSLTGTLVGRRDDSDYLTDSNFGNSLLLPNRNLLGSYERLDLGGGYRITPRWKVYVDMQNLLSEHYFEAFGYPALPFTFRAGMQLNFGGESWKW